MTNENIPMVYFIAKSSFKDEQPDFIKIGYTYKPLSLRQTAIQTGNEARLWDIGVIPFDNEDEAKNKEKEIHSHFGGFRAEGEWFYATTRLMKYIENNAIQHTELLNQTMSDELDETTERTFGQHLSKKRNEVGMTQEQLANLVGCSPGYVSFLEQNRGIPGEQIYEKLIETLGEFSEDSTEKNLKNSLAVKMDNGQWISEEKAIETFIEVIKEIGIEKVKKRNINVNGIGLISQYDYDGKAQKSVEVENQTYYIVSGTNTIKKKRILEDISKQLKLNLLVLVNPLK